MSKTQKQGMELLTEATLVIESGVNLAAIIEEDIRNGRPVSEAAILALNEFKLSHLALDGFLTELLKELKGNSNGDH